MRNKVSLEEILAKVKKVEYTLLGDNKTTVANVFLENGYNVQGISSCVDPNNYDPKIGEKIAYDNAIDQIWSLEGYLLAEDIYRSKKEN